MLALLACVPLAHADQSTARPMPPPPAAAAARNRPPSREGCRAQGSRRQRLSAREPGRPGNARPRRQCLRRRGRRVRGPGRGRAHEFRPRRRRILFAAPGVRRLRDHARCAREGAGAPPRATCISTRPAIRSPRASTDGPLSAGIPGEPAAFDYLARRFGKLPLKVSLQPAIRLAREGFPAVCAPAGRDPLQARRTAALARCGEGVSDRRTARCRNSAPSSSSRISPIRSRRSRSRARKAFMAGASRRIW